MRITSVAPGCYHLEGPESSALLGCPPEILKTLLQRKKSVPRVGILPDLPHHNGVSQMALEFLGYWFLFMEQGYQSGRKFRVLGTPALCRRLHEILRITLLGPSRSEMRKWGLPEGRVEMLARMADGMALRRGGRVLPVEELFEFVRLSGTGGGAAVPIFPGDGSCRIQRLGGNRFRVLDRDKARVLDLNFRGEQLLPLADLSGGIEKPERLRLKVLGCYTGFDPAGPTTGMLLWVNGNGFLVDSPAGARQYLEQTGFPRERLTALIQTHVHDDHCALSELLLDGRPLEVVSTREIYESAVLKTAAITGETRAKVKSRMKFTEVVPGKACRLYGALWEFFYTVHSIPTVGFRVTVRDEEGKAHTLLHSSDSDHFKGMARLVEGGAVGREHFRRMKGLVRGDERLAMIDAGGGLIHGEPSDWDGAISRFPRTEFLFYHVNPSKVDSSKYQVARPGWGRTFLSERMTPLSVHTGLAGALKKMGVKDEAWTRILLSQGRTVEFPSRHEWRGKGRPGDSVYFVLSGTLEIRSRKGRRRTPSAVLESGEFFRAGSRGPMVTRTPVVLFEWPGELFLELMENKGLKGWPSVPA